MRLADKVAIISGAASGMGAATARMFAREGAKVETGTGRCAVGRTKPDIHFSSQEVGRTGSESEDPRDLSILYLHSRRRLSVVGQRSR